MRAAKKEALFPPGCCRQLISFDLIAEKMTTEELEAFGASEVEISTGDRAYYSNVYCDKKILMVLLRVTSLFEFLKID